MNLNERFDNGLFRIPAACLNLSLNAAAQAASRPRGLYSTGQFSERDGKKCRLSTLSGCCSLPTVDGDSNVYYYFFTMGP